MKFKENSGQNTVEYMLIFAIVAIVIVLGLAPNGFFTQAFNKSLNMSVNSIQGFAEDTCLAEWDTSAWRACTRGRQRRTVSCAHACCDPDAKPARFRDCN